ncbi:transporter major facilitator family protein [Alistipes finegoldii CAG:68]|nr:transporter major facilitator family protein [Alistipes finegoldii CAG:68]
MESARKTCVTKVMPILFSFFVMGFCDVVGISTTYVKNDFNLSEALAGFIPSMVFLWFLLLSVPVALAMNRVGRKRTVQISNVITIVGMLIPFVSYNFATCMVAFALLGIGNTILQVSLNPLLTNVVSGESLTSSLTAGQVVKAVSSFMGPIIAVFAVNVFGNWQYLFPIFAAITLLSSLWLMMTSIPKEEVSLQSGSSVGATFSLLKDSHILLFFIGILCTVGLDVGMNTLTPKLLIERCGLEITDAGLGSSVYFFCRTAGAFLRPSGRRILRRFPAGASLGRPLPARKPHRDARGAGRALFRQQLHRDTDLCGRLRLRPLVRLLDRLLAGIAPPPGQGQ